MICSPEPLRLVIILGVSHLIVTREGGRQASVELGLTPHTGSCDDGKF